MRDAMIDHPSPPCSLPRPDVQRRRLLQYLCATSLAGATAVMAAETPTLLRRTVPRSGELLPVIGLGTYLVLDVAADAPEIGELRDVLRGFADGGASVPPGDTRGLRTGRCRGSRGSNATGEAAVLRSAFTI